LLLCFGYCFYNITPLPDRSQVFNLRSPLSVILYRILKKLQLEKNAIWDKADEKYPLVPRFAGLSSSFVIRAYSYVRPFLGIADALHLDFFAHPSKFAFRP